MLTPTSSGPYPCNRCEAGCEASTGLSWMLSRSFSVQNSGRGCGSCRRLFSLPSLSFWYGSLTFEATDVLRMVSMAQAHSRERFLSPDNSWKQLRPSRPGTDYMVASAAIAKFISARPDYLVMLSHGPMTSPTVPSTQASSPNRLASFEAAPASRRHSKIPSTGTPTSQPAASVLKRALHTYTRTASTISRY